MMVLDLDCKGCSDSAIVWKLFSKSMFNWKMSQKYSTCQNNTAGCRKLS